jgi:hypothetical protein
LLEFTENVSKCLDEGTPVDVIYLDFKKAFDKVPHERLIVKLSEHGIGGDILVWIANWLKNRKQRVVINGEFSNWSNVVSGVPQGSVLGPVLFTVYINDLDRGIKNTVKKFADDTKLYGRAGSNEEIMSIRADLKCLEDWSNMWQMQFNAEKCKVMYLGNRNIKAKYQVAGVEIGRVAEEKDLGVYIDESFKVGNQCCKAAKKGNKILGMIARTFVSRN